MKKTNLSFLHKFVGIGSTIVTVGIIVGVTFHIVKPTTTKTPESKPPVFVNDETENKTKSTINSDKWSFVNPPLPGKDIPFKSYSIDANKGGSFTYKGSRVIIPANIFCDKNGKDIKGKVEIKYREFHNPIEFFLSGIPMTYDSGCVKYTFQSAGMLDIKGEKDGQPVIIKEGKSIDISMVSKTKGNYNVYILDTLKKNWVYLSKNTDVYPMQIDTQHMDPRKKAISQAMLAKIKGEIESLDRTRPIEPRKANKKNVSFTLDYSSKDYPELDAFGSTIFEVDSKTKNFSHSFSSKTWDGFTLRRIGNTDNYGVSLTKDTETHYFTAYPVLDPKDYRKAMKEFKKNYTDYLTARNKLTRELTTPEEFNKLIEKEEKEQELVQARYETQSCIVRHLTVDKFSIYNCDYILQDANASAIVANLKDDAHDSLKGVCFYMADFTRNALFTYYDGRTMHFDTKSKNLIWYVTRNNKIAIFTPEEFKNITTSDSYTFNLKTIDTPITTEGDVVTIFDKYL